MQTSLPLLTIAVLGLAVPGITQDAAPVERPNAAPAEVSAVTAAPAPKANAPVVRVVRPTKRVVFPDRAAAATPTPAPVPQVLEEERPRTFWERLFGRRRHPEPEEPAATPAATPKATPRSRKIKPATTPVPDGLPAATQTPKSAKVKSPPVEKAVEGSTTEKLAVLNADPTAPVKTTTKPVEASSVLKTTPAPKATPVAKTRGKSKDAAAVAAAVGPNADADAEAKDKHNYDDAKNKALEDPEVRKLKDKADGATNDDEARKAQRAYNKALFNKMRSIDGSIKDRADRIEASIMKRLDSPE